MNSSTYRRPGAFSPRAPASPGPYQSRPQSSNASESDSSSSSQVTAQSRDTHSPQPQFTRPYAFASANANSSTTSVNNFSRTAPARQASSELPPRAVPPAQGHRRQHSQGFFEPSLPTATLSEQSSMGGNLTASQIAAQAAMQHQTSSYHSRNRSQTTPTPNQSPPGTITGRRKPPPIQTAVDLQRKPHGPQTPGIRNYNGGMGGHSAAAVTAANVALPHSSKTSPGLTHFEFPEKEHKLKTERSKMKLFSKPKSSSSKEVEKSMPSPNKVERPNGLSKMINPSVTSLADSLVSGASIYSTNNASTSTLVPLDRQTTYEKEKAHKHHFLSRQKNKIKDKIADDHPLQLSSASSNSKPIDPSAPASLYNFSPAPSSPASTSFSGLDLRHAGRALREKKKEEKAVPGYAPPFAPKKADIDRVDWATGGAISGGTGLAPSLFGVPSSSSHTANSSASSTLQGFGLNNMRSEDAWDVLKANLRVVFDGDELRIPVEDLNGLVIAHIQKCINTRSAPTVIEDLRDLLQTGFTSLNQSLYNIPDHRLVPHLVDMWLFVFAKLLPYMQAVFLPLDLEFKGHGSLMTAQQAAEFWGANPDSTDSAFGNEFDVRRIVLLSYRDNIILAHYEALKATFSRLSLDSINVGVSPVVDSFDGIIGGRPGTAASLDPGIASFNSQGSTLLGDGGRSRATSNLSAPELPSFGSSLPRRQGPPDSSQVTETVGRMLQCVSVLASVQSGDDSQSKMEDLAKALKLNWLGRGRTGRNRMGFVGTRAPARPMREGNGLAEREAEGRMGSRL